MGGDVPPELAAAPAAAESAASAAMVPAVDMPAGNSAGAPVTTSDGDRQFEQLFASWERMDKVSAGVATTSVSVPSAMPLTDARLSSGYGMRNHPVLGGRRGHKGVDLAAPTGTPVYATADGFVSKADWFSSYGKFVSIEHGARLQTRFAQMSDIAVEAVPEVPNRCETRRTRSLRCSIAMQFRPSRIGAITVFTKAATGSPKAAWPSPHVPSSAVTCTHTEPSPPPGIAPGSRE